MSLRSGTAASRFYTAFYRWTVLGSSPSAGHGPRFTGRRAISEGREPPNEEVRAARKRRKGAWVGKRNSAQKTISFGQNTTEDDSHSKIDDATVRSSNQEADQKSSPTTEGSSQSSSKACSGNDHQEGATENMASQSGTIRTAPVQSPQEMPFSALGPREHAVRHRTDAGCIVEFAVEKKAFGKLQSRWGSLLEGIGRGQGVKAEVRDARTWHNASRSYVYPVIIWGPTDQVDTIKRRLVQASNHTTLGASDKPMRPTPIEPLHNNLKVYSSMVRHQLDGEMAISICVPEAKWRNIKAEALNRETVSALPGVSFEVGTPEQRTYRLCEDAYLVQGREVTIAGPRDGVGKLSGKIWSVLFRPADLREDTDWLKITAGTYGYESREVPSSNSMPAAKKETGAVTPSASEHKDIRSKNGSNPPRDSVVFEPLGVGEDREMRKITEGARTSQVAKVATPGTTASETADVRGTANRTSADPPSPTPISQPASEPRDLFKLVVEITAHDMWALGRALLHGQLIQTLSDDSGCSNTNVSPVVFEKSPFVITSWGTQAQVASFQSRVESIAKLKAAELKLDGYGIECRTSRRTEIAKFEGEVTQTQVRTAMRSLSHPVVVITSTLPAPGDVRGTGDVRHRHRGVTVSSFTTVALSPEPIISFNLKVPSSSWEAIRKSEKMQIHLLAASPRGAAIAHAFTQPYEQPNGAFDAVRKLGVAVMCKSSGFPPWLSDSHGDINYVFRAKPLAEKCVEVGDHVIVVATVTRVQTYPASLRTLINPEGKDPDEFDGLAYASGGYRRRGASIQQSKDEKPPQEEQSPRLVEEPPQNTQPIEYKPPHAPQPLSNRMVPQSSTSDPSESASPDASPVRNYPLTARDHDPLTLGTGRKDHPPKRTRQPSTVPLPRFQDDNVSPFMSHDPIYQALRNAREAGIGGDGGEPIGQSRTGFEEAEDHDLGLERAAYPGDNSAESPANTEHGAETAYEAFAAFSHATDDQTTSARSPSSEAYEGEIDQAMQQGHHNEPEELENDSEKHVQAADAEHKRSGTHDQTPSNLDASKPVEPTSHNGPALTPFGLGSFEKRSISTAAFPRQFQSAKRFFSTTPHMHWKEKRRVVKQAKEAQARQIDQVEPTARQITVADFFNLPDDTNPKRPPRVRSLVRLKKQADRARRLLETIPERLDPQQKAEFLHTIDTHERIIARKMAWNSAMELRIMLDKGASRVDFEKARWMEESMERGQAILVDEARRLKQQAEERSISAEDFAEERAKLEELQVVLQTEMTRLRDVVEEADGSGGDRWDDDD